MIVKWQSIILWKRIFIALVLGVIIGLIAHYNSGADFISTWIKPFGDGFVRLIKMLILPLIITTLVSGVIAMGDPKRLGSLGLKTIIFYLGTTFFAVILGMVFAGILKPGLGIDLSNVDMALRGSLESKVTTTEFSAVEQILSIIPDNPFKSIVEGQILPVIFFSLIIGIGIIVSGEAAAPLKSFFISAETVVMKITLFVMELAPIGVFALIAWVMSDQGLSIIPAMGKLAIALYLACIFQIVFVYGGVIIKLLLRMPALSFFGGILDAQGVAYSTASSSATLPVSIACAQHNLGIDESVAGSVLPLGATINMDGTAIYLGIIALFAAQAFGVELGLMQYGLIALTAAVTSIGAAGIPSASLFLAYTVLGSIGMSLEQYSLIIAFIFPFDRVLDMMRTMTNVTGDLAIASLVAKSENQLSVEIFKRSSYH